MDIYLNTAATDISRARTVGLNQLTPEPFPVLVVGTRSNVKFFFANRGTLEDWSGDSDYSLRLTVGNANAGPIASTFELTVGSEDPVSIPFDIDAAGLKNILNDSPTIVEDGTVDVVTQGLGRFLIAYNTLGLPTDITVDGALLLPDCDAELSTLRTGSSTVRQLLMLTLRRTLPAQTEAFNLITTPHAGWSGTIALDSAAAVELIRLNGVERGAVIECTSLLTLEVITPTGDTNCYYQTPVTLRAPNFMIAQLLPVGPSANAQASTAAGTINIVPESQIHTETVTVTGSATTRDLVIAASPLLGAGARVDVLVLFPEGATNGTLIRVWGIRDGGELSYNAFSFTRSGDEPNALFVFYRSEGEGILGKESVIPAFVDV